jgi:hypothetical protein
MSRLLRRFMAPSRPRRTRSPVARPASPKARLLLQALEGRIVPATFTVLNTNDSGAGSLRDAITQANANPGTDAIAFDPTVFSVPATISLVSALPAITDSLTITGPDLANGLPQLTVQRSPTAASQFGIFFMQGAYTVTVDLSNLTISGGIAPTGYGGGIETLGTTPGAVQDRAPTINLTNMVITGNSARRFGGGIFALMGAVTMENCTVAGNSPGSMGFGRFVFGPGGVNNYVFAIDDATGQAGPSPDAQGLVRGWGFIKAVKARYGATATSGDFVWTATPGNKLNFALDTLVNPTMVGTDVGGPMANFDPAQAYAWPAVHWDGMYSGPTDATSLSASTAFDTSGFVNAAPGTFGWSLDVPNHTLSLTYTPTAVPEPGTLTLAGMAAISWVTFWRRRRQSNGLSATLPS